MKKDLLLFFTCFYSQITGIANMSIFLVSLELTGLIEEKQDRTPFLQVPRVERRGLRSALWWQLSVPDGFTAKLDQLPF